MTQLQTVIDSLRRLPASMTPGLRIVAILLMLAICVSLTLIFQATHVETTEMLFDNYAFTQAELQQIEVAFAKAQLNDHKIIGRRVRIPSKQRSVYVAAIQDAGVLEPTNSHATDALNKMNLFEDSLTKRARIHNAIERDLARQLRVLPGIEEAYVRIRITEGRGLQAKTSVAASVSVRSEVRSPLSPLTVKTIRGIVAGEHEQLSAIDVTVNDLTAGVTYLAGEATFATHSNSNAFSDAAAESESRIQAKVEKCLQSFAGARVVVSSRLPVAGRAEGDDSFQQYCVFVEVPASFYRHSWIRRSKLSGKPGELPTDRDLKLIRASAEAEIQRRTRNLLGDGIVVEVSQFDDDAISDTRLSGTTFRDQIAKNWSFGLVAGALLFFGWNLRNGLRPTLPVENSDTEHGAQNDDDEPVEEIIPMPAGDLRERLTSVVRNDPNAAAKVLQDWLKEAG